MRRKEPATRRAVIAGLASIPLAGCGGVLRGERPRLDGAAIRAAVEGTPPTVPETVPVEIGDRYLATSARRVRALLDTVPLPLGPDEVPNGAIRERLAAAATRARDRLAAADGAASRYEAMRSIRQARSEAAEVAAGWRAIDDGLTRVDLLDDAEAIERDVTDFEGEWSYVGSDPVRATLVHRRIELGIDRARGAVSIDRASLDREQESPVSVGDLGGDLERARAQLDDVSYLYERFTGSLEDPLDRGGTIRTAADTMAGTVQSRIEALPAFDEGDPSASVDRDIADTPEAWALRDLYYDATAPGWKRGGADGRPAQTLLEAEAMLAHLGAFTDLHGRIAAGDPVGIDAASTVASARSAAVAAIESARTGSGPPGLVNPGLAHATMRVGSADHDLAAVDDEVTARSIARDVGQYLAARAIAGAVPAAAARIVTALEG